jgi:hypothetical protein
MIVNEINDTNKTWQRMKRTKAYNLTEIPAIPVVVQSVVPCTWRHLSHTRCECISGRPRCLYFFSTCPSRPSCITQTKIPSTLRSVSVNMPAWNSDIDSCCWVDLHVLREVGHASTEILRPLTADVVCDKNPGEYDTYECRKNDKINTTIPKDKIFSCRMI